MANAGRGQAIVGRSSELEAVEDLLAATDEGVAALFLEGPAGIGKTRLWQEAVDRAGGRGHRVLATRPGGGEVRLAFAGLADLLADTLDDLLPELAPPQRRALSVALLLEDAEGAAPDDRAVAAAFLAALRLLAARGGVVVAIDDVQWLDAASRRVVEFALRRLDDDPVAVLATFRISPDEMEPVELIRAVRSERMVRLPVGPLTLAALYELFRTRLGEAFPRPTLLRLHEASAGNPFFALELGRALVRAGGQPARREPLPVPRGLEELVRSRIRTLSAGARETLLLVSALSQPTLGVVEYASPRPLHLPDELDEAAQAGIVHLEGERIRFEHPLFASIHYSSVSAGRRSALHLRLAEAVPDPEERARHLALGTIGTDESVAVALETAAATARARGALAAAAELVDDALVKTPASDPTALRRRRLAAAEGHYAAGDTPRALELLEEELRRETVGHHRAELLWSIGKIRFEGEDTRVGLEYFRRALDETGDDDLLRARILESMAFPAGKQESLEAAEAYAAEAVELAERLGDTATLARALAILGSIASTRGEGVAAEMYERAVALEEELGGLELDYGPTSMYARTLFMNGEPDRARTLLERLCERGRAAGDAAVNLPLWSLSQLEFSTGNWERAEALARESYDVAVQSGREAAEPKGMYALALVEAGRGEIESARRRAEAALVLTDGRGWNSSGPRGALCFLELSLENFEAAYKVAMPAIERYWSLGAPVIVETFDAAEALAGLGRLEEGRALLDRGRDAPGMLRAPWAIAADARARGQLAAAADDLAGAEAWLVRAVDASERASSPLGLGRSLLALGTVQRRGRKKQAARTTLERALELFERLGAPLWAARARGELGRIGGRSAPRGELSGTESGIVELVVAGRSNKEVARALHLSPKTVEWNLSRIYRKLGVHSRTELAAARGRPGPSP